MPSIQELLKLGQEAMAQGHWPQAAQFFGSVVQRQSQHAGAWHNLGVSSLALGKAHTAIEACDKAFTLSGNLWQSQLIKGKASYQLGLIDQAQRSFISVLHADPSNAPARVALADLYMNRLGQPLKASQLVQPLLQQPEHREDAELTQLMAGLYDRDASADEHNARVMAFSRRSLRLDADTNERLTRQKKQRSAEIVRKRPRVGLISPQFCVSPVYFLTIEGWQHVAKGCDIVVFNRGHNQDWATERFQKLASQWHNVQEMSAQHLAQELLDADIDVLYDLGGWMDPVALKALSIKPARKMFKWVGGQSVTTGLESFDGWIGDTWQSPDRLQYLYSEPLVNIAQGYAHYTPPSYMPAIPHTKRDQPVIFSNPAKLSRAFLKHLQTIKGRKCFIHRQFQFAAARENILNFLDPSEVEFICPQNHQEALHMLGQHKTMLDTFPYSSGLTAREAQAMGVKVIAKAGLLFCERHTARLV